MSRYVTLLGSIDAKGKAFMTEQRNALRAAYMQSKAATKFNGWTVNDDHSFEAIDLMVANLAQDGGFQIAPQQPAGVRPTTDDIKRMQSEGGQTQA